MTWTIPGLNILIFLLVALTPFGSPPAVAEGAGEQQPEIEPVTTSSIPTSESSNQEQRDSESYSEKFERMRRENMEENIKKYGPKVEEYIDYLSSVYLEDFIFAPEERITGVGKSGRVEGLPVLEKIALFNPRPAYRVLAIKAIDILSSYSGDYSSLPALTEALSDSVTNVQWQAAKTLCSFGDTASATPIIIRIAQGIDKDQWSADWAFHMGLGFMSAEQISNAKERAKQAWQCGAIELLGACEIEESDSIIRMIYENAVDSRIRSCAAAASGYRYTSQSQHVSGELP